MGEHDAGRDAAPRIDRDDGLDALRALIVEPERRRLAALESRLDDPDAQADVLGDLLPKVLLEHAQDAHFTNALAPSLEKAITASVQRNPKPLSDALFPVMGPAIRKAVSAGLAGMVDSLNRTLEHAFSRRSLQWRLEALRTGKSFGEVVLLKTLLYRVEQVFLIDRRTGLLLQHAWAESVDVQDGDMVSGMLTAIKDFVQDSFKVASSESLEALKVGELSVWIEPGPHAIVAAVMRGSAPPAFRRTLQETVESIHLQFGNVLESFNGDTAGLADAKNALEACLHTEYRADERRPRARQAWMLAAVVILALLVWGGLRYRSAARWSAYLDALRAEPGVMVVSADRRWNGFVLTGLRDPLARDPRSLLAGAGLSADDVDATWTPYYALDPALVVARARGVLHPPDGASLTIRDGVLGVTGRATVEWVAEATRLAPFVAGVQSFDAGGALETLALEAIAGIQAQRLLFVRGSARLVAGQEPDVRQLSEHVRALDRIAEAAGIRYAMEIVGHTDADGPDSANVPLSRARAEALRAAVLTTPPARITVVTDGEGSRRPVVVSENEQEKQRNRRVEIRVTRVAGARP